jgi:glycosyltransferase involved in cell wall biosynthesis
MVKKFSLKRFIKSATRSGASTSEAPERKKDDFRVVALLCVYNEERFISQILSHYREQGVDVFLLNDGSTDRSEEHAREFLGKGLVEIRNLKRDNGYQWEKLLKLKASLQDEIDSDWFIHTDADEFRMPPPGYRTLKDWFFELDSRGYSAANFQEYTFLPCRESPEHDHADFQRTLKGYYPFKSGQLHRVTAWKKQKNGVDLHGMAGHVVQFTGEKLAPENGSMRHYLFLSPDHLRQKYAMREYDARESARGWHGWRNELTLDCPVRLPAQSDLNIWEPGKGFQQEKNRDEHFKFMSAPGA